MKSLLLLLIFLFPLQAFAGEAIVNSQVEVDVVGKTPEDARSQGMAKAEVDALKDLLGKLAPSGTTPDIIAQLDSRKISKMIKNSEVLDEKTTENRYHAHIIVSFDGDELSDLITKTSAQTLENKESTVSSFLIFPAYSQDGSKQVLWEDDNPWRIVWKNVGLEVVSGDVIVPYGDATDSNAIDAKNLGIISYAALTPVTIRYGVSDIVILDAKLTSKPDLTLSITKHRIARGRSEVNVLTYRADPQETRDLLLTRAARDIVYNLQHKKSEELATVQNVRGGERNKLMILASISTLNSWTKLRESLSTLPMVEQVEVLAISARQVDMVLHYRGAADALARAITAQKIKLTQDKDYWIVSRE